MREQAKFYTKGNTTTYWGIERRIDMHDALKLIISRSPAATREVWEVDL